MFNYIIQVFIIITIFILFLFNYEIDFKLIKTKKTAKEVCLENLLYDINNNTYFSYYRIEDFRCGYNITYNNHEYTKNILEKEILNKNNRYIHEIYNNKIFYNKACCGVGIDYIKGKK
jgi:hypothetical protein